MTRKKARAAAPAAAAPKEAAGAEQFVALDADAALQGAVYRLLPGAEEQDRHAALARSLTLDGALFKPEWGLFRGRMMLSLREAAALACGMNPRHPATDLAWTRQYVRHAPPGIAVRLRRYEEVIELAQASTALAKVPARAGGGAQDTRVELLEFAKRAPGWRISLAPEFQELYAMPSPAAPVRTQKRSVQQDEWMLEWLRCQNHDPMRLPKEKSGPSGLRSSAAKAAFEEAPSLFVSMNVGKKTWDRLRSSGKTAIE